VLHDARSPFLLVLLLAPLCAIAGESVEPGVGDAAGLAGWLITLALIAVVAGRSAVIQWQSLRRTALPGRGRPRLALPHSYVSMKFLISSSVVAGCAAGGAIVVAILFVVRTRS
jgi:hypothetical protein